MNFNGMGNIEIIDRLSTPEEMLELYKEADCFVFPSRGEGFGMPPIEAMATGLPTIFTNHTGMMDYADTDYNYPINVSHKTPAIRFPKDWGYVGNWFEPDFEHFKDLMWHVYTHREEAKNKGKLASKIMHDNFNYDVVADRIVKAIQKHHN
jgi:glycosyltransferase involved in cell wall biosynthesis